jgi:hypothetical protein
MKNLITILLVLMVSITNAQVYINISNNTFITFDGGITVTLDSQTPNTISKIGNVGGILTNSENDKLRWNIGNATGQFYVPFSSSFGNTIPFIYDITSGGAKFNPQVKVYINTIPYRIKELDYILDNVV